MDPSDAPHLTVGEYATTWLQAQRERMRSESVDRYAKVVRLYLVPWIGDEAVASLTVPRVDRLLRTLSERGGRNDRALSSSTVAGAASTLRRMLDGAVEDGLLERNVARMVDPPEAPERDCADQMQLWTVEEVRRFTDAIYADRHREAWELALGTGMLRSEIVGLRWDDVDLRQGAITVRMGFDARGGDTPLRSVEGMQVRDITIDGRLVDMLTWRREVQARERERAGDLWRDTWGLVLTEQGRHLSPNSLTARLPRLAEQIGVPRVRLLDLRHTHAALLLEAGVPMEAVSRRLGHSSADVTRRMYGHLLEADHVDPAEAWHEHVFRDGR